MEQQAYDVLIAGGSYAGLQAALTLGRCLKNVLVIDSGKPCNHCVLTAHNTLTLDGMRPDEIRTVTREQVLAYPTVSIMEGTVSSAMREGAMFTVTTENGDSYTAKKLLLATGLKDVLPDIPGFEACWGRSIVHCPYCHGYEVRDKDIALMANSEAAKEFLPLAYNWSRNITLFIEDEMSEETKQFVADREIKVVQSTVAEVEHQDGFISYVITKGGTRHKHDVLFASPPTEQQTGIIEDLGCDTDDKGYIEVDIVSKTNVPGLYAAGDCTTPMRAISVALASGYKAAIGINNELTKEAMELRTTAIDHHKTV